MESEKRYKASTRGYIVDRTNADVMDTHETADRLNALEAERDAWEKKSDHWRDKCKATMAERDRYKAALERIVSGFPNDEGNGILWNVYPNAYTGDPEQVQENPYEVARAMLAVATQAL